MLSEYLKLKENWIEFKFNFLVQYNGQYIDIFCELVIDLLFKYLFNIELYLPFYNEICISNIFKCVDYINKELSL